MLLALYNKVLNKKIIMKKSILKIFIVLLSLPVVLTQFSCNSCIEEEGKITTEKYYFDKFDELEINMTGTVYIHQSKEHYVSVKIGKNHRQYLEVAGSGNKLKITADKCLKNNIIPEIHIYAQNFEEINVSGSAKVKTVKEIKGDDIEISVSGSGTVELELDYKKIETEIDGSGDLILRGRAEKHNLSVDGSGDLSAYALITEKTNATVKGSGNCKVFATEKLTAKVKGSGDLKYKGKPKKVDTDISGSGSINMK